MTHEEHNALLYGEPGTDDEALCDKHGARMGYFDWGWGCPECEAEKREREREECVFDNEVRVAAMPAYPPDADAECRLIVGNGFIGYHCRIGWWA